MRIAWRTTLQAAGVSRGGGLRRDDGLRRDVALICLADGIVGVSFGAAAVAGGLPWWVPAALSALVFAGGSQIAAVGVVLAGGSPLAAVAAGAVLNTRLLPYGLAVADVIRPVGSQPAGQPQSPPGRRSPRLARVARLLAGTQLITDESVAFALRRPDPAARRRAFWTCGATLFAVWNATVLLGVLLGTAVSNTGAFGLDAAFPAVVLALALPTLTARPARIAAGTGAVIAVALTPVLPAGLPLLAALGGLATRWRPGGARPGPSRSSRSATVNPEELPAGGNR
jgi:branched chain amino acid efflux pump